MGSCGMTNKHYSARLSMLHVASAQGNAIHISCARAMLSLVPCFRENASQEVTKSGQAIATHVSCTDAMLEGVEYLRSHKQLLSRSFWVCLSIQVLLQRFAHFSL